MKESTTPHLFNQEEPTYSIRDFYPAEGFTSQLPHNGNTNDNDSQQTGSFMVQSQDHDERKALQLKKQHQSLLEPALQNITLKKSMRAFEDIIIEDPLAEEKEYSKQAGAHFGRAKSFV